MYWSLHIDRKKKYLRKHMSAAALVAQRDEDEDDDDDDDNDNEMTGHQANNKVLRDGTKFPKQGIAFLMQDGARAHTAKLSLEKINVPETFVTPYLNHKYVQSCRGVTTSDIELSGQTQRKFEIDYHRSVLNIMNRAEAHEMADTSLYSVEERLVVSVWVHERSHTGKTMEDI
ncbi:hypothetical protein C0J52_03735 [Blattella germanica]|nr:hypothetical protein C0J52_03735 [Blattella germanica]